jgi:Putative small multi-drug export protein
MQEFFIALPKVISIFAVAFFTFWPAIPAGLALGLSPAVVVFTTTLSYICGVALVLMPGERLRGWVMQRWGRQTEQPGLIGRVWSRYGVIGLGLLAPMTVGAQIGAVLGLSSNVAPRRLLMWMALGALAWSVLLTTAVLLGVLGAQSLH